MTITEQAATPAWPYPGVATVHALVAALGLEGEPVTQQAQAVRQFTETPAWGYAPPVLQRDVRRWLGLLWTSSQADLSITAQFAAGETITGQLIDLVGPKGYIHGWVYVGGPGLPSVASHNAKLKAKGIIPPTKAHPALTREPPAVKAKAPAKAAAVKSAPGRVPAVKPEAAAAAPKPAEPKALRGDAAYDHVAEPSGKKERDAADYYSVGSGRLNPSLRNGTALTDKTDKAQVRNLESAFTKVPPTTRHIVAYRGTTGALFGKGDATGTHFTDKGFTSVSTDRRQAGMFGSEADPALMEIHVPAGSRVVKPGAAGHYSEGDEAEKELVLNHGGRYEITSDEVVNDPVLGKIRKLTATYRGQA